MQQLLTPGDKRYKLGRFRWRENDDWIVVGKYDGSTFQGSDRLSMSVMADLPRMLAYIRNAGKPAIFEGDRFSNRNFLRLAQPFVIRIQGDGAAGRAARGSAQTQRQIRAIATRMDNLPYNTLTQDSQSALSLLKSLTWTQST